MLQYFCDVANASDFSKIDLVSVAFVTEILQNHSNQIKWNLHRHDNFSVTLNRILKLYYRILDWVEVIWNFFAGGGSNVPLLTVIRTVRGKEGSLGCWQGNHTILGVKGIQIWRGGAQWVKTRQTKKTIICKLIQCAGSENYYYNKILRVKSTFYMAS